MLKEALGNVGRFCGYGLARGLPLDRLRWLGSRATLKYILESLDINCVLDVGANQGQYGMALRGIGYQGWIISFEPVSASFEHLENLASRNGRWRVYQYALGSANDSLSINVMPFSALSSFLAPKEDSLTRFPDNRVKETEEVAVRRLDDVVENCLSGIESPRIYLKMDTQGFDLEVMQGAASTLEKVLALQTEVSFRSIYVGMPNFVQAITEFQARGFEVVDFLPVSSEFDGLCAIEMDCIMSRPPQ